MEFFRFLNKLNLSGNKTRWAESIHARTKRVTHAIKTLSPQHIEELIQHIPQFMAKTSQSVIPKLLLIGFVAYLLADTVSLFTNSFIPEAPKVSVQQFLNKNIKGSSLEQYNSIILRNIFNSKGLEPEEGGLSTGLARKTTLPLNLIGTVVLQDELKSMATIEDKSASMIYPVRVNDTIPSKAKITKIEHLRVYFINQTNGHLEFVEIVEEPMSINTESLRPRAALPKGATGISQLDETHYDVQRTAVDKALGNLNEVLQQARAIPNFENGVSDGYRLLQIVPGSIYDQLGLKNGDVVTGLNGEVISDPGKAFQLFNDLKTSNHLEIVIKRNGQTKQIQYDIR